MIKTIQTPFSLSADTVKTANAMAFVELLRILAFETQNHDIKLSEIRSTYNVRYNVLIKL